LYGFAFGDNVEIFKEKILYLSCLRCIEMLICKWIILTLLVSYSYSENFLVVRVEENFVCKIFVVDENCKLNIEY